MSNDIYLVAEKTCSSTLSNSNIPQTNKNILVNTRQKPNNNGTILWLEETYNAARGETALWVAVITQAMQDALSKCKKAESIYQKHEATIWLTENSKDFVDVCLCAGMNPDYVRRKAKKTLAAPKLWRAEAGTGKRYEERKKYRQKQKEEANKNNVFSITGNYLCQ